MDEADDGLRGSFHRHRQIPLLLVLTECRGQEPYAKRQDLRQTFPIRLQVQPFHDIGLGGNHEQQPLRMILIPEIPQFLMQVEIPHIPFGHAEAVFQIMQ